MSFGGDCLVNKINQRIANVTSSTYSSSQLAASARSSLERSMCCVNTIADLPCAACNEGRFIYVTSCRSFRYSDGFQWVANGCSVFGFAGYDLWTWGNNNQGQLGDGTTTQRCSPGTVAGGGTNWCQVSSSLNQQTTAIKTDGTLWTWGCNGQGRLGDGTTVNRCSPGTTAGGGTNWRQVSSGSNHAAAIKTDGTLWTWGFNAQGRLGDGTATNRLSPVTVAGAGTNWCQVSAGNVHMSAIKTDGTLWTWGCNNLGTLGDGTTTARCSPGTVAGAGTNWCQVFGGTSHAAAIKTDGTLWTWGNNGQGILGNGTTTNRCSPGTVAGGGTNWCQVAAGAFHTAAIKTDGTLWTWGYNGQGRLGDGTTTARSSPGTVAGCGTNWCQVSGGNQTVAIKTDGTLWTWGCNNLAVLGDGTTTQRCSPGTVAGGGTTWCLVSSGNFHTAALRTRGF